MEQVREIVQSIVSELKIRNMKSIVSINEAARVLERDRRFVYELINEGYLRKVKIKGASYVTIRSLEKLQLTGTRQEYQCTTCPAVESNPVPGAKRHKMCNRCYRDEVAD